MPMSGKNVSAGLNIVIKVESHLCLFTESQDTLYPGAHRAGEAGEGACNLYKRQNSNMAAYAKISNIHIWRLWGYPQAEGNMKLGFHTSASLIAVS